MSKAISLFFWSSKVFENKALENYGDLLSPYIVEKVSGHTVTFYNAPKGRKKVFKKRYVMGIGSIMSYASKKAMVWGSGIISRKDVFPEARFCAVRGPLSRKRILELGYACPEIYGDPALLLPRYYAPDHIEKKVYGIIPHYVDYAGVRGVTSGDENIHVVDLLTDDALKTTNEILRCEGVLSSSLHGVIVAHAYGIPAVWVRFSDNLSGDNVKFEDYFESVGIEPYTGELLSQKIDMNVIQQVLNTYPSLPKKERITEIQESLIKAFPAL